MGQHKKAIDTLVKAYRIQSVIRFVAQFSSECDINQCVCFQNFTQVSGFIFKILLFEIFS